MEKTAFFGTRSFFISFSVQNVRIKKRRHAVVIVGIGHAAADRAHLGRGIAHGNARAGSAQHAQIVTSSVMPRVKRSFG